MRRFRFAFYPPGRKLEDRLLSVLRPLPFDLAYLAMLSQRGIKPLSRWEAAWDNRAEHALHELGLLYRPIARTTANGREVRELVFSASQASLDAYAHQFDQRPLSRTREAGRAEGSLFGYPPCCVESFLARGYARNGLCGRDQRMLFHWACPDCSVSPQLAKSYREVYESCRRARGSWVPGLRVGPCACAAPRRLAEVVSWAALLVATTGFGLAGSHAAEYPHVLPTEGDADGDGLIDGEEMYFGADPALLDTDGNGFPDGYDVARRLWQEIQDLPTTESEHTPYVKRYPARGLVACEVCGESVNMGYTVVFNPVEQTGAFFPILAEHCMEHGGFPYRSIPALHVGRVDPCRLDTVINNHPAPRVAAEPKGVTLHWHGLDEMTYQVHEANALNGPWTPVATYEGADAELRHDDTNTTGAAGGFYRLAWEDAPQP